MATNLERTIARKLIAMTKDREAQATDPDKWNTEFEALAVKLACECLRPPARRRTSE